MLYAMNSGLIESYLFPRKSYRAFFFAPLRQIKQRTAFQRDFFDSSETFAIVRQKGKPVEVKAACFRLVQDAVALLALSQLGYRQRRFTGHIDLLGMHDAETLQYMFVNTNDPSMAGGHKIARHTRPLVLDRQWKRFQDDLFYSKLLRILALRDVPDKEWHRDIRRASILAGESMNSNDLAFSFLWNMIALELLLKGKGQEKYTTVYPKKLEAFLGWAGLWSVKGYTVTMHDVYAKRNALVHEGDRWSITKHDLLFTDDLILNLLINIVNLWSIFDTRRKVMEFAEKVEAEHVLGLPPRVQPKKLTYVSRAYTEKDLAEM
jgi:hypothetical protein